MKQTQIGITARTTRWAMVAIAVLSVAIAVAVPGYQFWLIIFGGVLIAWATFGLLTEEYREGNTEDNKTHRDQPRSQHGSPGVIRDI